jgi:hypothetical protein
MSVSTSVRLLPCLPLANTSLHAVTQPFTLVIFTANLARILSRVKNSRCSCRTPCS